MDLFQVLERGAISFRLPSRMIAVSCAALLAASCATGPDGQALTVEDARAELASRERIVCEEVATTGTRFTKRVCWSETQRQSQRAAADRLTSQIRENSTIGEVLSGPGQFGPPVPAQQ